MPATPFLVWVDGFIAQMDVMSSYLSTLGYPLAFALAGMVVGGVVSWFLHRAEERRVGLRMMGALSNNRRGDGLIANPAGAAMRNGRPLGRGQRRPGRPGQGSRNMGLDTRMPNGRRAYKVERWSKQADGSWNKDYSNGPPAKKR